MKTQSLTTLLTNGGTPTTNAIARYGSGIFALSLVGVLATLYLWGHAAFNTSNWGITWGLPIIAYEYLAATSIGLTFIASLAMIFGFKEFYPVAKRCVWLALATLVAGFTALALELGHPFRMLWAMPTGLQYVSPMFWKGVFYIVYLPLLLAVFFRVHVGDWNSRTTRWLGIAYFASAVIALASMGLVFGMMSMRPAWYDGLMPVYFLATAALSGAAFAVLFTYVAYGIDRNRMPSGVRALAAGSTLPHVFATMVGIVILSVVARVITGLWVNYDGMQVFDEMIGSPWFHLELWVGLTLPFALMLHPRLQREPKWQVTAAVLVMAGLFIGRYEYVVAGQIVPVFKGSWIQGLIEYTPSFAEWLIVVVAVSMVFAIYAFGEKYLNLAAAPAENG